MAAARCISGRTFVNNDPPTAVVVATPSRRHSNVSQSLWQLLQSLHDVFRQHVPARVMGHAMAFEYQNRGCPVVHTVFYLAFAAQVISRYVSGCNRQQEVTCRASLLRNAETLDEEWYIPTYTGCVDTGCVDIRPVTQNSTQVATTWLEQMSTLESSFAVELSTGIRGNYVHRLATCHTHM
ncbi:TPA: hypothetical protein ACH3X3_002210 [Trebouxia sp. C0006]